MMAYANPEDRMDEKKRGDGYGIVRFDKLQRTITFECWPRFCDVSEGDKVQYPGWPITVKMDDNDGRTPVGWLPELMVSGSESPVIQVINQEDGEILYTVRATGNRFRPPVYAEGKYTVKIGTDRPDGKTLRNLRPGSADSDATRAVKLQ
jgi:hypothetical protein